MADWSLILASLLVPVVPLFFQGNCGCCSLCWCQPATNFQVDVTGVASSACTANCTAYNSTFYLTGPTTQCSGVAGDCLYKYADTSTSAICSEGISTCNGICIDIFQFRNTPSAGDYTTRVRFNRRRNPGGSCSYYGWLSVWEYYHGTSQPDCSAYSGGLSFTDVTASMPPGTTHSGDCDFSAATVTVSQS